MIAIATREREAKLRARRRILDPNAPAVRFDNRPRDRQPHSHAVGFGGEEWVKEPGKLFGRNTVGGLIDITSSRPSLKEWTGGITGMYGNYNLWDVRASASAPVVPDRLGLGVGIGRPDETPVLGLARARLGVAAEVCAPDEVHSAALAWAERLAAQPPLAVRVRGATPGW